MLKEIIENTWEKPIWQFREKNKKNIIIEPNLISSADKTEGNLYAKKRFYTANDDSITTVLLTDFGNIAVYIEKFGFKVPKCAYTTLILPSDNDFKCNIADKNRLVIRDSGTGIKFFRIESNTDGADTLSDSGLLFPDGFNADGKIRLTPYSGLYCFGNQQFAAYIIVQSSSDQIGQWHIRKNGCYQICDTNDVCKFKVNIDNNKMSLEDIENCSLISVDTQREYV